MKAKLLLLIGLFLMGFSMPSEAQIFKKFGKKIEKKVKERIDRKERKADQKVDQKIDESMDKAEQGAQNTVLDWISGGDDDAEHSSEGASSATSETHIPTATAPQNENYKLSITGSGPDIFMTYKLDTDTEQMQDLPAGMGDFEMHLKLYASTGLKRSRSEVVTQIPMLGEMRMATISNMEDPDHIVMINEKKKTYAIMDFSGDQDQDSENYRIEVLGKEKIHGLNTTHVRIIADELEDFIFEMWISKDLPGYQKILDIYKKSGQLGDSKIWNEIIKADADGFVIRMEGRQQGVTTRMELQDIQQAELPNSLFEIPANYKKKKSIASGMF